MYQVGLSLPTLGLPFKNIWAHFGEISTQRSQIYSHVANPKGLLGPLYSWVTGILFLMSWGRTLHVLSG